MDKCIYEDKEHKVVLLGFGESAREEGVPSNQYLIVHKDKGVLIDPGGFGLFPSLLSRLLKYVEVDNIEAIFLSHQDPDVSGGVNIWAEVTSANIYISKVWLRFIPHYDIKDPSKITPVEEGIREIHITEDFVLKTIPAHFLHSPGQINIYDPVSKVLFSGDIGASMLPCSKNILFVEDFEEFLPCIEKFHVRYMASNKAIRAWLKYIEELDVDIIAPQHGFLFKGEVKDKFLKWLSELKCGVDIIEDINGKVDFQKER